MTEELRPYTFGTAGRLDKDGTVWYACDPYPTWYRWDGDDPFTGKLITPDFGVIGSPGQYSKEGTFPGWAE